MSTFARLVTENSSMGSISLVFAAAISQLTSAYTKNLAVHIHHNTFITIKWSSKQLNREGLQNIIIIQNYNAILQYNTTVQYCNKIGLKYSAVKSNTVGLHKICL